MNKDIVKLIEEALKHMGCSTDVMSKLNADAPIVFSFNNGVVMNLSVVNDAIWLWAPIDDYSEQLITLYGAQFLALMMQPYPFFITGKMHLSHDNGQLLLQGLVNPEALEKSAYFAATLQVFFDTTLKLRQIIKE